jgi:CTP synthase (UTP-ammonia lyase)
MSFPLKIALVGDYSAEVVAHRALPLALKSAGQATDQDVDWQWVATRDLRDASRDLASFHGVWVVPRSPYENMAGVLAAIRWARETQRPILGSCGGFQHMLIEFARNVAGLRDADHAETNPDGRTLVISKLLCPLVEKSARVQFAPGSRLREIYGHDSAEEGYHCSYGVDPTHRAILENAGLRFTVHDDGGEIRGAELPVARHPFFMGTLFQPERAALRNAPVPLANAFVRAVASTFRVDA